ncbi:MAG: MFS transporter [Coriobacteriales bacterium]|jgi:MFS family permease|nr:MFS transporter [Coriobacteriales bacterium]
MARQINTQSFATKATLLLCSCDSNALGAVITPIMAVLALTFPGENVNLMVMLPPLFIIPTSLLAGKLSYYISRKTLLTIGQILYIIGGVGAAWFYDFNYILIMRILLGIGCGIVYPIVPTLIAQFYSGRERAAMLGRANAVGGIIAMLMSLAAGMLATIGWHLPFYVDLFFVLVLIMQLLFLPKVPPEKTMAALAASRNEPALSATQKHFGARAWLCIALMFVTMTLGMVFLLKMAIIVSERGIGDAAFAGVVSSCQIAAAFLTALSFPLVYGFMKRFTIIIPILATALSFIFISLAQGIVMVLIGACIFGVYLGYAIPYLQTTVSGLVHPARRTFALTVLSTALFAGQAASTPFVTLVESMIGASSSELFITMSVASVILAVIVIAYLAATNKGFSGYPYATVAELEEPPSSTSESPVNATPRI